MRKLGIKYWKMDAENYEYPVKAFPWNPKDTVDPRLKEIRDDRGYSYADIISIIPDHLPGFEDKPNNNTIRMATTATTLYYRTIIITMIRRVVMIRTVL
jgi:hypothetical protein